MLFPISWDPLHLGDGFLCLWPWRLLELIVGADTGCFLYWLKEFYQSSHCRNKRDPGRRVLPYPGEYRIIIALPRLRSLAHLEWSYTCAGSPLKIRNTLIIWMEISNVVWVPPPLPRRFCLTTGCYGSFEQSLWPWSTQKWKWPHVSLTKVNAITQVVLHTLLSFWV